MRIPVLIEPVGRNGYRARATEPFAVSAKGSTREDALAKLRAKIEGRLKKGAQIVGLEVGARNDPWMEFAGMFRAIRGLKTGNDPSRSTARKWTRIQTRYELVHPRHGYLAALAGRTSAGDRPRTGRRAGRSGHFRHQKTT